MIESSSKKEMGTGELKFARDQGFFDSSPGITLLIGVAFAAVLFFFLHFREVRVEVIDLNNVAERYIVAQTDFEFSDQEATAILRQESIRDIDRIWKVSDKEVRQRRTEFENYLIYNQDWRQLAENSTFEEMYRAVGLLESFLTKLRLTDSRTLQKIREMGLETASYQVYTPSDPEAAVVLPGSLWRYVQGNAFVDDSLQMGTVDFIVRYFKGRSWDLEEDVVAQRQLRKAVQARVPEKLTHVNAGDRIIDQGERVTTRHLAMLDAMKEELSENRKLWHWETLLGSLTLTLTLLYILYSYFHINHRHILESNRKLFLVATIVASTLILAKLLEYFLLRTQGNIAESVRYPVIVPYASILLCSLTSPAIAVVLSAFLTVLLTMTLAVDQHGFMIINLASALIAILSTRNLRRRKEVFAVCAKAWFTCGGLIIAMQLYDRTITGGLSFVSDLASVAFFLSLVAVLVVGVLPLLESAFQIMTDVTLMEYMDPNHDLLRRLSIEAPGTYQHSLVVGQLAETAALAIGANGLFCRVAALYHDVGKLTTPHYFTENQQGGMNMHQLLTPLESAQVIIAHVPEGVTMARKAGLPEQFVDIIKEHHGTTLVYYFYAKQVEQMGGDKSLVDERDFRYMGPKPRSRESAILMIADSFEAAGRSLDVMNEQTLTELVERLVGDKARDGQLDESHLTFEDLRKLKHALVQAMVNAGHPRIKYPHREEETIHVSDDEAPPPESTVG